MEHTSHGSFQRFLTCSLAALCSLWLTAKADDFEFFEKRIRPVLVERCYKCHSAQSEKIRSGLLLDTKEGLLQGGESGQPAIVPGKAEESRLIEAIRYKNEDLQMPPGNAGGKLGDQQVADFIAWVNMGAADPRTNREAKSSKLKAKSSAPHWAFQPPKDHPLPPVRLTSWPTSPVDYFILAKLEQNGLNPSPRADKRTLLRRATYDLTGLSPTPGEVEAFLQDNASDAFRKTVERLLASPRYGERWGRYWLDVARYSDTKGYVYDREEKRFVHSHVYRDWVIRAFNEDLRYDQFLMLQIAADELCGNAEQTSRLSGSPGDDPDGKTGSRRSASSSAFGPRGTPVLPCDRRDLAAMGFLTVGRRFLGVMHDIIDDRIDVLTRGTMGLTVACARCHDHKYDPIPTEDYYSLYGVFYNTSERTVPLLNQPQPTQDYDEYAKGLGEREQKLDKTFQTKRNELTDRLRAKVADYLMAVLDVKKLPSEEFYTIMGPDDLNPVIVRQWEAYFFKTRDRFHPIFAPWHELAALPELDFATRAGAICAKLVAVEDPRVRVNPLVLQAFADSPPASMREVAQRYGKLFGEVDKAWREAVKAATESKRTLPTALDPNQEPIRQVLYGADSPANVPDGAIIDIEWFFDENSRVELAKLQADIDRWLLKAGAPPHAVILADRPALRNARVFLRGNPANKGEEVPRQFLELLSGQQRRPFERGSGRAELAQAIASRGNPLTARVMVNRIWLHHFGAGLVRTPSDFGTRCEMPSHPELLDWLALRFMENEWSIKQMHRLMMLSSVYQQSSDVGPASSLPGAKLPASRSRGQVLAAGRMPALQFDPDNRLLWRMSRQRLDFEAMRDSLLAVSGELDSSGGGKAVELFKRPFSKGRTVYGFIDRQFLPGVFRVFDYANPDLHSPQRSDTTVPQQALFFMNSPFALEAARALNGRAEVQRSKNAEDRIRQLYQLVYQRPASSKQVELGLKFIKTALAEPPPEPPKPVVSVWQYGFGEYDEAEKRIKSFQPLPHFTGEAWQGGPKWPDQKLGWVQLTAEGGHAGNDLQHAAIRRWIAPRDGNVMIGGTVHHEHQEGDGVQARIISSRTGILGSWGLHNDKAEVKIQSTEVKKGDTLDFVVDFRANLNSDMFKWSPVIKPAKATRATGEDETEWNAKKDFAGPPAPPPAPLDAWEKYAHVLLLSNEFLFVD